MTGVDFLEKQPSAPPHSRTLARARSPHNTVCRRGVVTEDYKKTIGVDFLEKQLYVPSLGEDVRLFVWDTAGQEEFDSLTRTYYRGGWRPQPPV